MLSKIMIVDDARFMRVMLKDILSKEEYEVVAQLENGIQAMEQYKELKPDLVIMDITMPQMDGISALKEIREIDPEAKVIMCSAMAQKNKVKEALKMGAKDFIVKPFQKEQLLKAVRKCLLGP